MSTRDDPPVPPLPVDPSNPRKDIYGNKSFPPLDGVNVWPMLTAPGNYSIDGAHAQLVLSKEVIISRQYKLLVTQPYFKTQNNGWKQQNGVWRQPHANESFDCMQQDASPKASALPVTVGGGIPCLFDLRQDPGEHVNLAAQHPDIVQQLWLALNTTVMGQRDCSGHSGPIPGPTQQDGITTGCSPPSLLGSCDASCAAAHWTRISGKPDGPVCGVLGC